MKTYETGHGTFYAYIQDVKIEFNFGQEYILSIIDRIITHIKETKNANCVTYCDDKKSVIFDDYNSEWSYVFEIKKRINNKIRHLYFISAAS